MSRSVAKLEDGLHPALDREAYDKIARCNFSRLKSMGRSAAHYRHALTEKAKDTDPMRLGRVIHVAAFEPERFALMVAVWDGDARRGKDWDRFCAEHAGQELLTEHQYDVCMAVQKAVRSDATAMRFLSNGRGEQTMLWTWEAGAGPSQLRIPCRGRVDFIGRSGMIDLKTTTDASPEAFGRRAYSMKYHVQAAWYSDAHQTLTGARLPYFIVAAEVDAPHVVQVFEVNEHVLELGRETYRQWLDILAHCTRTSTWPAYREGVAELELPAWTMGDDGLGLEWDDDDKKPSTTRYGGLPLEET